VDLGVVRAGSGGGGVCGDEEQARRAAAAWMRANGAESGTVEQYGWRPARGTCWTALLAESRIQLSRVPPFSACPDRPEMYLDPWDSARS
jgi:hypothetical protein